MFMIDPSATLRSVIFCPLLFGRAVGEALRSARVLRTAAQCRKAILEGGPLGSLVIEPPPEPVLVADVDALIDGECVDYDYRCCPIHHLD